MHLFYCIVSFVSSVIYRLRKFSVIIALSNISCDLQSSCSANAKHLIDTYILLLLWMHIIIISHANIDHQTHRSHWSHCSLLKTLYNDFWLQSEIKKNLQNYRRKICILVPMLKCRWNSLLLGSFLNNIITIEIIWFYIIVYFEAIYYSMISFCRIYSKSERPNVNQMKNFSVKCSAVHENRQKWNRFIKLLMVNFFLSWSVWLNFII